MKPKVKQRRYVDSVEEMSEILGMSREHFHRRYYSKEGCPKKGARGIDVAATELFVANEKEKQKKGDGGLKDEKLSVEIEILKIKRDELLRTLIPIEEHIQEIEQFHAIGSSVLSKWISSLSAITKDKAAVAAAESLIDSTLNAWREMIESK